MAQNLIEHRKQAATKTVLTLLENYLTTAFAMDQELATDEPQVLIRHPDP